MKILYYSPHPTLNLSDPSGYGTHMRQMIGAFRKLGHDVTPMIAGGVEPGSTLSQRSFARTVKKVAKSFFPRYLWETLKDYRLKQFDCQYRKQLAQQIEKLKPDLIYERATYLQSSGVETARAHGVKHFLEVNSPYVEERVDISGKSAFLGAGERCEAIQMKMTDQVIVVSSALKDYFLSRHDIAPGKITVIANAVNPDHMHIANSHSESLRDQWQLHGKTIVGFVGAIFPWHGVDVLLRSVVELIRDNDQVRLLIVGGGQYLDGLKQLANELRIADSVVFTDNVATTLVPAYINLMDIAVAPRSGWYQSPIKIFEYGGLGKPIIAHDTVPARDVMINGVDGLLVESTEDSIATALKKLIRDCNLREKLAGTFQKKVMANYTWDRAAQKVLSLCDLPTEAL